MPFRAVHLCRGLVHVDEHVRVVEVLHLRLLAEPDVHRSGLPEAVTNSLDELLCQVPRDVVGKAARPPELVRDDVGARLEVLDDFEKL